MITFDSKVYDKENSAISETINEKPTKQTLRQLEADLRCPTKPAFSIIARQVYRLQSFYLKQSQVLYPGDPATRELPDAVITAKLFINDVPNSTLKTEEDWMKEACCHLGLPPSQP